MRKTLLVVMSAVVSSLSVTASAADLPARAYPTAPAVVPSPIYDWSGFYIGINGGGGTSSFDWNLDGVGDEGSHNATGGTFGAQFGYRWQLASWVFGVETLVNWADFTGSNISLQTGDQNQSEISGFGLFTGQIGYAWNNALFYVKGGTAVTNNKYTAFLTPGVVDDAAAETRWGAAVGAGFEYGITPNLSFGFEYNHLFMGNKDVIFASGFSDQINENVNLYLARLNYRFGGPY
jgi:outer membrane immunogenic protein